ncbi:hypothetical protein Ddye_027102 [Dipteronia dyeriana]|uniref:Bulb-type lectin domain-containing protein n=1 Tax=Dipteronia dyeriana TaxID=168575 RepID=A0AAD9TNF9_9ROSI|nr:hypothetical protein Ddye_027102 [Dipteronia dyeriana]
MTTLPVANRDFPISDPSGVLYINSRGSCPSEEHKRIVWSSNTSRNPQNPVAVLFGSGNVVVKDGKKIRRFFLEESYAHQGCTNYNNKSEG